ncbi:MAG: lipoate--protein ligase [Pseudomonadota bacterium]
MQDTAKNRNAMLISSTDPTFNLALEESLFQKLNPNSQGIFLLWQNAPSVIVGRHQNTAEEVSTDYAKVHDIAVVRRMTGGGAVYHDAGNVNFSFLEWRDTVGSINFHEYLQPIQAALAELGLDVQFSSRNDLEVEGKKISGSAQVRKANKILHHGTLLINVNTEVLSQVLTGSPEKYQSKGIASMRARVGNMADFWRKGTTMQDLYAVLMRHCAQQVIALPKEFAESAEKLANEKYRTWAWNYGHAPAFTHSFAKRFAWGKVECCLDVRKGIIQNCQLFGDFFAQQDAQDLETCLLGCEHRKDAVAERLSALDMRVYFAGCETPEVVGFFVENMPV